MSGLKRRQKRPDLPRDADRSTSTSAHPADHRVQATVSTVLSKPLSPLVTRVITHLVVAVVMLLAGWQARTITEAPAPTVPLPDGPAPQPWRLDAHYDDFIMRTYNTHDLHAVRDLHNVTGFFTGMCGRYRFNDSLFPPVSVIITLQNEQPGMLTLTVHSILARTPPSLLREVIIVDDNGRHPDLRKRVNQSELDALSEVSPKVVFVSNTVREGVARSRMAGARRATSEALVFMDSHVEMLSATWLQHLMIPVLEQPATLASMTLDIISDLDWTYGTGSGDLLYGVITDEFWFGYQRSRFGGPGDDGRERESPGRRLPYETPFVPGSMFAVRRDWFFRIGGYDEGMFVWGGENTDFAIKTWTCGGRVVMVPCSRAGHMYRQHIKQTGGQWPPVLPRDLTDRLNLGGASGWKIHGGETDNFTKITTRNNIRVVERWANGYSVQPGFYKKRFGKSTLQGQWKKFASEMETDPYAIEQEEVIQRMGCKRFKWFDTHVFYRLTGVHHPWHPETPGRSWV